MRLDGARLCRARSSAVVRQDRELLRPWKEKRADQAAQVDDKVHEAHQLVQDLLELLGNAFVGATAWVRREMR